ncbi:alpha-(1,3)-fucosyltransferase 7-like [Cydia fagiglandana]|uniref:alpha-(1,3)-fucosyltransferase 7-like n=1 Tax=Cydia fagiglandana TaxID=1458189 RepID=UPI002FEE4C82
MLRHNTKLNHQQYWSNLGTYRQAKEALPTLNPNLSRRLRQLKRPQLRLMAGAMTGPFLPDFTKRKPYQRWIFWSDEPPIYTFPDDFPQNRYNFYKLANVFNWSMTYRSDSDVPIPYGRTIPLLYPILGDINSGRLKQLVPYWALKQMEPLVAIVMSHFIEYRVRFVKHLQRFLNVDVFGSCSVYVNQTFTDKCPGRLAKDCPIIYKYLFYLVMENTICRQYISEKIFHNAYAKGAIPIIMGTPLEDCMNILPPNSFLHMDNFASVRDLAREIYAIRDNTSKLLSYHAWRMHFETVEEHGYMGTRSLALCRLCEALNYNDIAKKVYGIEDIMLYLDPAVCCSRNP